MECNFAAKRAKALVVSKCWDVRSDLTEYLEDLGVPSLVTDCFEDIPYLFFADYEPSYIFLGVDEFGGTAQLYDRLREMRNTMPNTAIILVSSELEGNEYGTHRLQLADISLCYPFTKLSLSLALKQAPGNLDVWKRRLVPSPVKSLAAWSADHGVLFLQR